MIGLRWAFVIFCCVVCSMLLVANGAGQEPVAGSPLRNDGYD